MKRILIDTNIVIDLLSKRKNFYDEAAEIFPRADKKELVLTVSSLAFANTNYILTNLTSPKEVRQILRKCKGLVEVFTLDDTVTGRAWSEESVGDVEGGVTG